MNIHEQAALDWDVAQTIGVGTSDEPLVRALPCDHWLVEPAYFNNGWVDATPDIWVRKGVYDRLVIAANALMPGYRLVLLDGWRPKTLQQFLFDKFHGEIAAANPQMSAAEIENETLHFVARASDDPTRPSPHITGGAIDLTLADETGQVLDMGSAFDETSDNSWTAATVPPEAAMRRKHLLDAMHHAGFTNLPSEWWHFDYGNWIWAWYSQRPDALYGPISWPGE